MKRLLPAALALAGLMAGPALAAEQTWKNASITDTMCYNKVKKDPDKHETKCLLKCQKSGYGMITEDGKLLKFDAEGNKMTVQALEATKKESGIRATIVGEQEGDKIKVKSIKIEE